jgi:two-component system response regulator HydG
MTTSVLVVDDDDALRETLVEALERLPIAVVAVASVAEALKRVDAQPFGVVVTDLKMKDADGFAVLEAVRGKQPNCRVILLTGHGSREVAVQAMQMGASYYIEKPVDLTELRTKVQRSVEEHKKDLAYEELRRQVQGSYGLEGIVGQDPKMLRVMEVVRQIAPTNASVLILGQSGTGKELVARAVHEYSGRSGKPFVALNCGGLSEGTIESELFGHVKGAYTGAHADRVGKF